MSDRIRINLTRRQNEIIEDLYEVAMTEHPDEEWAQMIKNEVIWRRTYIIAPLVFWENTADELDSDKEWRAQQAMENVYKSDYEHKQQFVYNQTLKAYVNFIKKIRRYVSAHKERQQQPPAPAVPDTFELVPPTPEPINDNSLYIGLSPTETEWVHYRDQAHRRGKDLETEIEFFMKHWQRWMSKKSPEELKRIYQRPRNAVEEQFVKLVKKPSVVHQGSVFRFLHR